MFRSRFFQTGIPYLGLALLFFATILYTEFFLERESSAPPIIKIAPSTDEDFESGSDSATGQELPNELVASLLSQISSNGLQIKGLLSSAEITTLNQQDRGRIIAELAQALLTKRDFANIEILLGSLTLEKRLLHNVQFTFAYALSKTGRSKDAIEQYEFFTASNPNAYAALLNQGLLLKKIGAHEKAILIFSKAADISSGFKKAKALAHLASAEYALSRYDGAVKHYKKSIEYRPDSPYTWSQLGKALMASGAQYQKAMNAYDKAVALDPKNSRLLLARANAQLDHYDYVSVTKNFKKATLLSKNDIKTHRLLAWAYLEQGKRNNAKKHINYLIQQETSSLRKASAELLLLYAQEHYKELLSRIKNVKSETDELRYLKGLANRRSGYYQSASTIFEGLSNSEAYKWRSNIQLARIKRSRKQYQPAIEMFQKLIHHNNAAAFLSFELSLTHEALSQTELALKAINHAITLNDQNNTYLLTKARYLQLLGNPNKAMRIVNQLLERSPNYTRGLRYQALLQLEIGDPVNAIKTYEKILSLEPSDTATLNQLAKILIERSQFTRAQNHLSKLLDEQTGNIEARYLLASAYYKNDQFSQALTELNNILRLDQEHKPAKELKKTINNKIIS
ncbi:MAG: tetratricopeptide repeat protein [Cycloclasticus sp.]|nr:tetratricopeptide repeat protein [Cycloclasticus sp.]